MKCVRISAGRVTVAFLLFILSASLASVSQENDPRISSMRDADHYDLRLPEISNLAQWKERQRVIRETLLLRSGLWPEPEKCPLNAKVFDERKGDGFTVAKVYFESLPGYFATGNLYRPSEGSPPYPAVITPHGHWEFGRLQNSERGSIPGRCIDFARMGFVVFSIDMVGYNDSFQLPHDPFKSRAQLRADEPLPYEPREFRGDFDFPEAELFGFNLGGVQLWNAIRGVDFLESLPCVDKDRIGATGASGGASQTIFLMIADDRIKVAAPVNIIGAQKHPGCKCENMPGLWLDTSTVEMAAAFSPKPLLLMSATEDPWTPMTPEREYPIIRRYYDLYGAGDMVKNVHVKAGHNYNADTRAAVYDWFCRHLNAPKPPIENPAPVSPELKKLGDLRVFPDRILPEHAVNGFRVIDNWKSVSEKAYVSFLPKSPSGMEAFIIRFRPMLARALSLNHPERVFSVEPVAEKQAGNMKVRTVRIGVAGDGTSWFEMETIESPLVKSGTALIVSDGVAGGFSQRDMRSIEPWVSDLVVKGYRVCRLRGYAAGERFITPKVWDSFSWPSTYNLSNELWAVHDIAAAVDVMKREYPGEKLVVAGLGKPGLAAAFACAVSGNADRVIIDLNGSDLGYDGELVRKFNVGGIKRAGDFRTAALLLMEKPFTLMNAGPTFDSTWYRDIAVRTGRGNNLDLRLEEESVRFTDLF